ncbi:MAG: RHS repeat-associated core domain-containing protein [Bergeyella cardium]
MVEKYIAFGEILFDEHNTEHTMPYLFNGKELDSETGLYYYGARYLDSKTSLWLNVDPLAETMPNWSSYIYSFNNPINYIDPNGMKPEDNYIDATTGKYLGSDGATTNNTRVIYRAEWNNITSEMNGSTSVEATKALQASSSIVTINNLKINMDINNANNETIADQTKERQVYIGIEITREDIPLAEVTSVRGPDGKNAEATITLEVRGKRTVFEGTKLIPIAQVHTHNLSQDKNIINIPGTSDKDKNSAHNLNFPIYSIDSYTGSQKNGNEIHRVMPNGIRTNNFGNINSHNIAQDALNYHINKQKK